MTRSTETRRQKEKREDKATDADLPPSLESLWRMIKLAYAIEPRLLVASLLMTLAVALPQSLVGLWLALLVDGVERRRPRPGCGWPRSAWRCPRRCCGGCRSSSTGSAAGSATGSRSRWRPRRRAARHGRDHRPPGAARAHGPARGAAPAHLRPGPPVHVAVLHPGLGAPAGHRRGAADDPGATRRWGCWCCSPCRPWWPRPGGRAIEQAVRRRVAQHERRARHLFVLGHDRRHRARSCG